MTSAQQTAALVATGCPIALDSFTRQLYATDASIYQVEPIAVAFPRTIRECSCVIERAAQSGIPVIPRGAGTGLAGGAIGEGLILDFSRHHRDITDLDLDRGTVRVGAGVVLDKLNAFLRPHGRTFGPDVATSSRATLGGMIANNSSGSHVPFYGTTVDHVLSLDIVLHDGRAVTIGPGHDTLRPHREMLEDLVYFHSLTIDEQMPPGLLKRRPGYALDRCKLDPGNLVPLLCGSEGTIAAIVGAELKIVPLPEKKGLGLVFFRSVAEAMQATTALLPLKPAAIEHIDRVLLDQTRGQLRFQAARDLLDLDGRPCEAILAVEFFNDSVSERLAALEDLHLGDRTLILKTAAHAGLVWEMRKAGLSLITGCKGPAKPTTGIEDVAVRPEDLPEYFTRLSKLITSQGMQASFYGHAASGLLHVRPVVDLHSPAQFAKFYQLTRDVAALVKEFKGSLAGEHGVGIARTEWMAQQVGDSLLGAMRQIKSTFDPYSIFNPGKIIPDGRYRFDSDLRIKPGTEISLPFEPFLAFAAKDESFVGNLEQCNGCGGCRKETSTMCPTFQATGEEGLSTRGRANIIRAVLEGRGENNGNPLQSEDLATVLESCLACKACATECPSNVNLPLIKAELLQARHRRHGTPLSRRLFSSVDLLGRLGCLFPRLANAALDSFLLRSLVAKTLGIALQRPLPHYARQRFDKWFARQTPAASPARGRLVLWDDTFARYHEPRVAIAAYKVLTAAGFRVELAAKRKCCGRPAFSQGDLDMAKSLGTHNVGLLDQDVDEAPIIFLEPSCYTMFVQDYAEMKIPGAARVAKRCFLFEDFIERLLEREPNALSFERKPGRVVIHGHCHVKSLHNPAFLGSLARRIPSQEVTLLDTGCCGMAGAFGALSSKYELSLKVAEPLAKRVREQPFGTTIVASGTSCRHQIGHLAPVHPKHMAEVLCESLKPPI